MNEDAPYDYDEIKAATLQEALRALLAEVIRWTEGA